MIAPEVHPPPTGCPVEPVVSWGNASAIAIDNAPLDASAGIRGESLQDPAATRRQPLTPDSDDDLHEHLHLVAELTTQIADADLVLMAFPTDMVRAQLRIVVSAGTDADQVRGQLVPVEGSLAGRVYTTGESELQAQLTDGTGLAPLPSGGVELGPVLCVSLAVSGRVHGVLAAARLAGRPGPTSDDVKKVTTVATLAATVLELTEARREREWARLLDERERIAADLHGRVIQRLFAAGLNLQGLTTIIGPGRAADRLQAAIDELDDTIKQIRTSVFQLQQDPRVLDTGVRGRLLDLLTEVTPVLGFAPALRLAGPLEGTLSEAIAEDLLAVLREALTNIARHADAHSADVDLTATGEQLTLRVGDDGHGMGPTQRDSGLANMRRRAEARCGTFTVTPRLPAGTVVSWSVPQRS